MKINPKYIQLAGDAIIPLAGILFFDWGLYFIMLFYCLDLVASEIIIQFKSKKVIDHNRETKKLWLRFASLSVLSLLLLFVLIHVAIYFIETGIDFKKEVIDFMTYEEMGIQQGYILIPLIGFAAYQQYKMNFLMPARYRSISLDQIWRPHLKVALIIIASAGLVIGLSQFVVFPPIVYVLSIVLTSAGYRLLEMRKM